MDKGRMSCMLDAYMHHHLFSSCRVARSGDTFGKLQIQRTLLRMTQFEREIQGCQQFITVGKGVPSLCQTDNSDS